jgi:hypothetical protein
VNASSLSSRLGGKAPFQAKHRENYQFITSLKILTAAIDCLKADHTNSASPIMQLESAS